MPDETKWITERIDATRIINPITDAASTRLAELLKVQLSERQLTTTEALTIAGLLILDMASPNKPGSEEES